MPRPTIDAADSVIRSYAAEGSPAEAVAAQMVSDAGFAPDGKVRVVVMVGDDAEGADEEVSCRNSTLAIELIAARVHELVGR